MISIRGLSKSFAGKPVLQGLDLDIHDGECLSIIGRSGCGKSVLLKHIIGLITPDEGTIIIDGEDLGTMSKEHLYKVRQKFGILFQGSALFDSMTVEDNIALALREHDLMPESEIQGVVENTLTMVGLPGIELLKPAELSGGMKKRVGLARAIALNPRYILYDEPTTGLDPIMADIINEMIIRLNEKLSVTTVVVTHDMVSSYKVATRIVMLHRGKIIFSGSPEETRNASDPVVRQFIEGSAEGPIKPILTDHIKK
ncbi:ABC transporter [bacterium SM23_57]|nr:MAG: ABC transporter [bacterium SM23_57]